MTTLTHMVDQTTSTAQLFVAFELGNKTWKLGFTTGVGQKPRERNIPARNGQAFLNELDRARQRFHVPPEALVVSCYEAGRDGFWLHRFLEAHGVSNVIVDSSSIEVQRRRKRVKTDRLDVHKLLTMLLRYHAGERRVWSVVRVPTVAEEDRRHLNRELVAVKRERTRITNRIKGLLANQGVSLPLKGDVPAQLDGVRLWDGSALPSDLLRRLKREWDTVIFLSDQIASIESERREALRHSDDASIEKVRQLMMLKGVGANSSWLFVMEFFGWRTFHNRKEVGALAGLTPTSRASGDVHHELGISKTGNRQLRAIAIEIAWGWLRFQPTSALTAWYQERFGRGSGRLRRIGIVALARRLLIALWQYLETGVLPEGAELKPTCPF